MKLKTFLFLTSVLICILFISLLKTVTFVPFKLKPLLTLNNFEEQTQLVTLPNHYFELKLKFPKIKKIANISELTEHQTAILPWNIDNQQLQFLKINNHAFYDSENGTIQVKSFRFNDDGYASFLKNNVKLTVGGTVVLARGVHRVIQRHNDILFPWHGTRHLFKTSDINVVNFKSPLVKDFSYPKSSWLLTGKRVYAKALRDVNIHVASIAGNHMGDAKLSGFAETITSLKSNGVVPVGGGNDIFEAYQCKVIKRHGQRFGFLAFNNVPGSIRKATQSSAGIAWLDEDALKSVKRCKKSVDFLTVLVNWGIEYVHYPREKERLFASKMAYAGADLIIGDQAHWVQNHEEFSGTHVSYGLGNYIFDQHWSEKTTEGIIQTFVIYNKKRIAVDTVPIKLNRSGQINEVPKDSIRYSEILKAYNLKMNDEKKI